MRVLAAMSGGVDSAVAAARLVAQGHDVTGVHLALSRNPRSQREGSRGCCSLEDSFDARRAADKIGIPFYVWDFSERFQADVVDDFVAEYAAGRTPNPCLRCNEKIKFSALAERAYALGFDAVATGHYARLSGGASSGRPGGASATYPRGHARGSGHSTTPAHPASREPCPDRRGRRDRPDHRDRTHPPIRRNTEESH